MNGRNDVEYRRGLII